MEKNNYAVDDWHELKQWSSRAAGDPAYIVEQKGLEMGEATDIFGDLQTAEDYGYVNRGYVPHTPRTALQPPEGKREWLWQGERMLRVVVAGSSHDISSSSPSAELSVPASSSESGGRLHRRGPCRCSLGTP